MYGDGVDKWNIGERDGSEGSDDRLHRAVGPQSTNPMIVQDQASLPSRIIQSTLEQCG